MSRHSSGQVRNTDDRFREIDERSPYRETGEKTYAKVAESLTVRATVLSEYAKARIVLATIIKIK